jgi:hypothetical protein
LIARSRGFFISPAIAWSIAACSRVPSMPASTGVLRCQTASGK